MSDLVGNPEDRFSHNGAQLQGVQRKMVLSSYFFKIIIFCFVVAIFYLVHNVKPIYIAYVNY